MNLDYFEYCKEMLLQIKNNIEQDNTYEIYKVIPLLLPVIAITYYCLVEDIIIKKDDKLTNSEEKLSSNVPIELINKIFEENESITITKKMSNSNLWLLSAIRNGIMHGAANVDIKDKKIIINNKSFKNELECEISHTWFINYLLKMDIRTNYICNSFSLILTNTIKQLDKGKLLKELESEYIFKNLIHFYKINIRVKDLNENLVPRNQLINFILNYMFDYINTFNFSMDSNDELSLVNCFKKNISRIESETDDEYNARIFRYYFKKHLKVNFEDNFPNYELEINSVIPKLELSDLLNKEELENIYQRKDIQEQINCISSWLNDELLKNILNPFENELFFREFINKFMMVNLYQQNIFVNDEDIKMLLDSNFDERIKGKNNIMMKIREYNKGKPCTYDEIITRMIIQQNFIGTDFLIANKAYEEVSQNYKDSDLYYYNPELINEMKNKSPYLFDKYSKLLRETHSISDQDDQIYRGLSLGEIEEIGELISQNKLYLIKMIIYLAGINCFVLNKESIFDKNDNVYENIFDENFLVYSKTVYEHDYRLKMQALDKIEVKLSKLKNIRFNVDRTPQHVIDKNNNEVNELEQMKSEILKQLSLYTIKEIDGIKMVKVDYKSCATIIRNCLSHPERIIIGDDLLIRLNDYDNKGNISGVVYVPFNNLMDFFLNDLLKKEMIVL